MTVVPKCSENRKDHRPKDRIVENAFDT